jgi:hypothetical protein
MSAVYKSQNGLQFKDGLTLFRPGGYQMDLANFDAYVCTNCGHVAIFISDRARLDLIEKNWQKVG